MKPFLHWLLVLSALVYGAGLTPMAHDEMLEQVALGAAYPGSEHALPHDGHNDCNHSCHAAGHSVGVMSAPRPVRPDAFVGGPPSYVTRAVPCDPPPPPTHPPMSA